MKDSDRLTAPLCNALIGGDDSQVILEYLEHANLFLIPLDDERRWYRYHHLFADSLRAGLDRVSHIVASFRLFDIGYHTDKGASVVAL